MANEISTRVDLSSDEHVQCPYKLYQLLHGDIGVGTDPALGTVVGIINRV